MKFDLYMLFCDTLRLTIKKVTQGWLREARKRKFVWLIQSVGDGI